MHGRAGCARSRDLGAHAEKYFLDPNFGGALVPGQRKCLSTTEIDGNCIDHRRAAFVAGGVTPADRTGSRTDTDRGRSTTTFSWVELMPARSLVNYNVGPFTLGGGDAFLQIPQTRHAHGRRRHLRAGNSDSNQVTCKFNQFRHIRGLRGTG